MVSWLGRLGLGLKKSSDRLSGGISDIFTKRKLNSETLEELEELLIGSDMGVKTSAKIIAAFGAQRQDKNIDAAEVRRLLADEIAKVLRPCQQPLAVDQYAKPFVIMMVGVNGAGKTTTIGKLAQKFTQQGLQVSLIAADTFRAAAVEQLEVWGKRSGVRVFRGENGCDSAGLCYDGLGQAVKAGDDVVFIDTAGRLQNKSGLMDELKKINKVVKKIIPEAPHSTILTLDATNGQNALAQVEIFKSAVDVSGLVITKLDGTAKGGILAAIADTEPTPVHYIGVGESIDDLNEFNADDYARNLLGIE
uniref:Signal recognition particle receptor FtsY n=1 Tax=uncultured Alphaproteobacteria bacterium TaxID=91750 RepID=A0A6G8F1X5_9PROT|nr:signal recognition particle receptor FtsY [uncultured Alphaproteobacteria bacterium]